MQPAITLTITLKLLGDTWYARFHDHKAKEVFDTDMLPTPFRRGADMERVRTVIQERNPDYCVRIEN